MSHTYLSSLLRLAHSADIVHNHSLWSMVNIAAGWVVPGTRAKLVTSPRGTLSKWALSNSRYKKQLVWPMQKRVLERADLLHATCEEEYQDVRALSLRAPVLILPNGVDVPELSPRSNKKVKRNVLFLSRLHPKKGLEILLNAWARLTQHHSDWNLQIVGPGDPNYLASLKSLSENLGLQNVFFRGPIYGDEKRLVFRNADLFVLPTHSENFGMVVAEALSFECPTIVSQGAPWAGLDRERCGWWICNNVESWRDALARAMSLSDDELKSMGARGRAWVERDFSWDTIAESMNSAYMWLVNGGSPPSCVREN